MSTIPQQVNETDAFEVAVFPAGCISDYIPFLQTQLAALFNGTDKTRPWHLWELHNPWGRSAQKIDSWKFLELCQSPDLLALITPLIGADIVLYDSQFAPDSCASGHSGRPWITDRLRCPVEPLAGLVVRIPFSASVHKQTSFVYQTGGCKPGAAQTRRVDFNPGRIICHDIRLHYHVQGLEHPTLPVEYVIRYFPATSRYLRDPTAKIQRELTERYPLLNYTQMPLWLVQGEDKGDNDFVTGFQLKAGRWITHERVGKALSQSH